MPSCSSLRGFCLPFAPLASFQTSLLDERLDLFGWCVSMPSLQASSDPWRWWTAKGSGSRCHRVLVWFFLSLGLQASFMEVAGNKQQHVLAGFVLTSFLFFAFSRCLFLQGS
jgi:hypothetical protein